jgi:hypothetical protein
MGRKSHAWGIPQWITSAVMQTYRIVFIVRWQVHVSTTVCIAAARAVAVARPIHRNGPRLWKTKISVVVSWLLGIFVLIMSGYEQRQQQQSQQSNGTETVVNQTTTVDHTVASLSQLL